LPHTRGIPLLNLDFGYSKAFFPAEIEINHIFHYSLYQKSLIHCIRYTFSAEYSDNNKPFSKFSISLPKKYEL
jgi:hypothetical protein